MVVEHVRRDASVFSADALARAVAAKLRLPPDDDDDDGLQVKPQNLHVHRETLFLRRRESERALKRTRGSGRK